MTEIDQIKARHKTDSQRLLKEDVYGEYSNYPSWESSLGDIAYLIGEVERLKVMANGFQASHEAAIKRIKELESERDDWYYEARNAEARLDV